MDLILDLCNKAVKGSVRHTCWDLRESTALPRQWRGMVSKPEGSPSTM